VGTGEQRLMMGKVPSLENGRVKRGENGQDIEETYLKGQTEEGVIKKAPGNAGMGDVSAQQENMI